MGELDEKITMDINLSGTIKLAENAKKAGVKRFIFQVLAQFTALVKI